MNLSNDWNRSAEIVRKYRQEADTHRLLAIAPRPGGSGWTVARALRAFATALARLAERLEPAQARTAGRDAVGWREANRAPRTAAQN